MRSTQEVFEDHLGKRMAGQVEEDIKANYAEDVILLTRSGMYKGHEGVRQCAEYLAKAVGEGQYSYDNRLVQDEYAFLEWSAKDGKTEICDGADSFVVRQGKIVFQTAHYTPVKE
jgi:hypothetical protein